MGGRREARWEGGRAASASANDRSQHQAGAKEKKNNPTIPDPLPQPPVGFERDSPPRGGFPWSVSPLGPGSLPRGSSTAKRGSRRRYSPLPPPRGGGRARPPQEQNQAPRLRPGPRRGAPAAAHVRREARARRR